MLKSLLAYSWASSPDRWAMAAAVTLSFAALARVLRGVDRSGMIAGGAACFVLFIGVGPSGFAVLAALFALTWVSTRFGYRRKQDLGVAERGDGRNARQVLANLAVPAIASAAFAVTGNRGWLFATAAVLAEAATDTVASEIGQTGSQTTLLITTWKQVAAGTDGGITLSGTIAGTLAGGFIAGVAAGTGMIPDSQVWIAALAGFVGMLVDSFLGASLQNRGKISNEGVNFISTIAAAALAYGIALFAAK